LFRKNNFTKIITNKPDTFIKQAIELVHAARQHVVRQTNSVMVFTYFQIGKLIVENEQGGKSKAIYGKATIIALSKKLTKEFGSGFSERNIEQMRSFYLAFSTKNVPILIPQTVSAELPKISKTQTPSAELISSSKPQTLSGKSLSDIFPLSWSHYIILSRIANEDEKSFYEIESSQTNWSVRELQRQFDSGLFERLSLSKDKKKVKQLAAKGQIIEKPEDVLKTPYVLDFLGLDEKAS
jgi:hypothetical protein